MTQRSPPSAGSFESGLKNCVVGALTGYNLKRAYMNVTAAARTALEPHGLRPLSLTTLSLIVENPGVAPSQIADALQIERPNIVAVLDELEDRGLMNRSRAEHDRRRLALTATASGQRLRDQAAADVARAEDRALAALCQDERANFLGLLRRLAAEQTSG